MLPNLGSPPPPFRKCPSAPGPTNRASAVARTSAPKRGTVGTVRQETRKWPKERERRRPRGCRDRNGPAGGAAKMAAARRGELRRGGGFRACRGRRGVSMWWQSGFRFQCAHGLCHRLYV
ncbi:Transmembrane protein 80 [Plecturocebus cupreus]